MKTIKLSKTDLEVSQICLGCMYFGARDSKNESFRRLDQFIETGGNFLDTANIYAHWINDKTKGGESELILGEWLKERKNRSKMIIASKVGFSYPGIEYGTSSKKIKEECDKSLKRLGTDYIDLYYAHTDDLNTLMEETLEAFNDLIKEGKVRYIGASNFKAWRLERARQISKQNGWAEYCCIQQRYSYLRPKSGWNFGGQIAVNDDLIEYVKDTGINLLAYSTLLNGAYTDSKKVLMEQYVGPDTEIRLKVIDEIAVEVGATRNQLVLFWLMNNNPIVIPLIASTTDAQFEEALGTFTIKLIDNQIRMMNEARF